jgi:hypothetical protein
LLGKSEAFDGLFLVVRNSHAFPATACRGLDHHRVTDLFRYLENLCSRACLCILDGRVLFGRRSFPLQQEGFVAWQDCGI